MNPDGITPAHEEGPRLCQQPEAVNLERNSMTSVQHFSFQNTDIRTVGHDGDVWFVASDVARILDIGRTQEATRNLDDDEKRGCTVDTSSGPQQMTIINEPGLYSLVLRSRKPEARAFKRWVTHEVIPAIRKTGGYQVASPAEQMAQGLIAAQQMLTEANQQLEAQEPIVDYHEKFVAEDDDLITVDRFASQYGTSAPKVRDALKAKDIAVRKFLGKRWSDSQERLVEEYEWRARQGLASSDWFALRPQHNAPRLHNGQVRQTMYIKQFHADELAKLLGLTTATPSLEVVA